MAPTADKLSGGDVQRIFYFHVGIAWIAGLAMFVTFICSILYLCARRTAQVRYCRRGVGGDRRGVRLDGAGCLACCGRGPVWNTWWTWDPRLTTTAITEFIYIAYLMLRGAIDDPQRRARFSAVYGIIGFVSVPLTYFSTKWFKTIHPDLGQTQGFGLTASMRPPMFIAHHRLYAGLHRVDAHPHAGRTLGRRSGAVEARDSQCVTAQTVPVTQNSTKRE